MRSESVPAGDRSPSSSLLDAACVERFLAHLVGLGYAPLTVCGKRRVAGAFARWTRRKELGLGDLDESHVEAFFREAGRWRRRGDGRRSTLLLLLEYLRTEGVVLAPPPTQDASDAGMLKDRYERYLLHERGLAEKTARLYGPVVRDFLAGGVGLKAPVGPAAIEPQHVREFLLSRVRARPTGSAKLLATALRSFLRFLFLRQETTADLSLAVPTVRQARLATVPRYVSPEAVEQILRASERTTTVGRRDGAVLLLLARLGLRAGEIVALKLDDIRWRTGEILVRGKNGILDRLPLPPDVGEAVALYLHHARPKSACREAFLRVRAPHRSLRTQTAVGHIVRRALARAGLRPSLRGAHLLRHSLATTMIRRGASMAEIAEILRHRSTDVTELYAKVDFEALRGVALPWATTGGAR